MARGPINKSVAPGVAPGRGEKAIFPATGGGELMIFMIAQSPNYYGSWCGTRIGNLRQMTLATTDFEQAKAKLFEAFGAACQGKEMREPKFSEMVASYIAGTQHKINEEKRRLLDRFLLPAFGSYPRSAMCGKAGQKALTDWHKSRQAAWDAEDHHAHSRPGPEVIYRHTRLVRYVLAHGGVKRDDLPALPKRPKTRRAALQQQDGEFRIIRAHLRARCSEYRAGTKQWRARMALRIYFNMLTRFTGRHGSELMSATWEGITTKTVAGKQWVAIEVQGKLGRDVRYGQTGVRRLLAVLRNIHPTGTGLLFDHGPMHPLFRSAMTALEESRNEPGKWSRRFVRKQESAGAVSLYSVRHARITHFERQGKPRAAIAKAFGTSPIQIQQQYSHLLDDDALAHL